MSVDVMLLVMPKDMEESDPSRAFHEDEAGYEDIIATDDLSGAKLKLELVAQARREEIRYVREVGIYEKVHINECWAQTGKAPIAVRWVDVSKGDGNHSNVCSRLAAKEFKT